MSNFDKWLKESGKDDKKIITVLKVSLDRIKKFFKGGRLKDNSH